MGQRLKISLTTYLLFSCSAPAATQSPPAVTAPTESSTVNPPPPSQRFPESVAGFQFGISLERFVELCKAAGFDPARSDDTAGAGCTGAASPMPFEVDHVLMYLCSGRACEYAVVTKPPGGSDATRVLAVLEERYGAALNPPYSPRCQANPPSSRHLWAWRGASADRMSFLRMLFDCEANQTPAQRTAILYYDNEDGAEWRRHQLKQQELDF